MAGSATKVVYAALIGNALVTATKFVAASFTHSSAMLSEAVHSLADTANEAVLLYGSRRAARPPDERHPLGYGREIYFWGFVVSLLIFSLGAGVSLYEGVHHLMHPEPMHSPWINYVVLGLAMLFEGGSWLVAKREFKRRKGDRSYLEAAKETKAPTTLIVLLEDTAALIGLALALAGTLAAQLLDEPRFDGVASIAIGLLLAVVAGFLARENKQLLIGEGALPELDESIERIARAEPGLAHFNGVLTFQLAPRQVAVALSVDFHDDMPASHVQKIVEKLEARIREAHPETVMVMIKPQTPEAYRKTRAKRLEAQSRGVDENSGNDSARFE